MTGRDEDLRAAPGGVAGVLLALAATGSFAAGPAFGQAATEPVTDLSLSIDLRHDSNVARADATRAAQRGLDRVDQRLTPGLELNFARPLGRNTLSVTGFVGYDFYRRNTRLNRERIGVAAAAGINAGPCLLDLMPAYERKQSDLSSIAGIAVPGIDSVRNTQQVQDYRAQLACGRPGGLRPLVRIQRTIADNSNVLRRISDYRSTRYGAGLGYANRVLGRYNLTFERDDTGYPHRLVAVGARGGYRVDELKLAASRDIGAILVADGTVAYTRLEPDDPAADDFKGISWSLAATAKPTPRSQARLSASRGVKPSLGAEALYVRNSDIAADLSYALTSRTSLSLGGSLGRRRYVAPGSTFGPALTRDRLLQVFAGASYSPLPQIRVGLEAGYEKRSANGTLFDYDSTYVALKTRYTF